MSLHFTVPNRTDESESECMKRLLHSPDYEKFVCLNPKQKIFFENMCLQSYNDIRVLLKDCMKETKSRK